VALVTLLTARIFRFFVSELDRVFHPVDEQTVQSLDRKGHHLHLTGDHGARVTLHLVAKADRAVTAWGPCSERSQAAIPPSLTAILMRRVFFLTNAFFTETEARKGKERSPEEFASGE
jgi:hypothetical protein